MDINTIIQILSENKDKNFVKRILDKNNYPDLDLGNGMRATHLMGWGQTDDGFVVFPNVVQQGNKLTRLKPKDAFNYAIKNNEFIKFKDPKMADGFSKNYKKFWDIKSR